MKKGVQKFLIYTGLNFPGLCSHGLNLERPKFGTRAECKDDKFQTFNFLNSDYHCSSSERL